QCKLSLGIHLPEAIYNLPHRIRFLINRNQPLCPASYPGRGRWGKGGPVKEWRRFRFGVPCCVFYFNMPAVRDRFARPKPFHYLYRFLKPSVAYLFSRPVPAGNFFVQRLSATDGNPKAVRKHIV